MWIPAPLPAVLLFSGGVLSQSFPLITTCSSKPGSSSPSLQYTISPNFIWFPGSVTPADILDLLRRTKSKLFDTTAGGPANAGGVIKTQIPNFFNSRCTMNLTIRISQATPPATTMRLLNETLGSTDLLCRLATHKTGRVFTEKPHTMLSMHLKAVVLQPSTSAPNGITSPATSAAPGPKMLPRQIHGDGVKAPPALPVTPGAAPPNPPAGQIDAPRQLPNDAPPKSPGREPWGFGLRPGAAARAPPTAAGFEYTITCPRSVGQPLTGAAAAAGLEGLKDLAIVRDCDWCRKAAGELQGLCGVPTTARADWEAVIRKTAWEFGGVTCEGCK